MSKCPHHEIVSFTDFTEYHIFIAKGWRCKWCGDEFILKPEPQPERGASQKERA